MKQISENIWEFDPQVYPQLLWVAVNPTDDEIKNFVTTYNNEEKNLILDFTSSHAVVHHVHLKDNPDTGSIIAFKNKEELNFKIVTHEAVHVVNNVYMVCHIDHNLNNDEPTAYLAGWVAKCCEKVKNEIENGNRTM